MRSPRLIYLAVTVVLAVAGFALTQYLADRSSPELGDTVLVPAGAGAPTGTPGTPPPSAGGTEEGADPVSPAPIKTAGDDDDRDNDGIDDDLDDSPGSGSGDDG